MFDSFVTLWTVTHQGPLSMGFPKQGYWSGLPFPSPQDLLIRDGTQLYCICKWFSGKEPLANAGDPLEKEMATHSSILAWRIPRTEEPGGLQSIALQSRTLLKRLSMHA